MQYGLLRCSFIPPKPILQLRELTRMRVHVQQDRNRVINRIGRLLETVNIKLSSVASHIAGNSRRAMPAALASGVHRPEVLAEKALGHLRGKIPDLILALDGRPDPHFQWMPTDPLRKLEGLDAELARIDARLCEQMAEHAALIERLSSIPGSSADGQSPDRGTRNRYDPVPHTRPSGQLGWPLPRQRGEGRETLLRQNTQRRPLSAPASWCRAHGQQRARKTAFWLDCFTVLRHGAV